MSAMPYNIRSGKPIIENRKDHGLKKPRTRHVSIIIDNCAYTPALLQAALEVSVAAKRSGYAEMCVIIPPALLYELSGHKAADAETLLHEDTEKDKGLRALRAAVEYGINEGVLMIPECSTAETLFFNTHPLPSRRSKKGPVLPGASSPKDFADAAIVDWLRKNSPGREHHVIVACPDNGAVASIVEVLPGTINTPDHLNYFEHFDQKCMALWLAEEAREIKEHHKARMTVPRESGGSYQQEMGKILKHLDSSLGELRSLKSDKAGRNNARIEKLLMRRPRHGQDDELPGH